MTAWLCTRRSTSRIGSRLRRRGRDSLSGSPSEADLSFSVRRTVAPGRLVTSAISAGAHPSLVPRVVAGVEVFETKSPDGRHLGDVSTRLRPVEMRRAAREHDDGTGWVRLQLLVVEIGPI